MPLAIRKLFQICTSDFFSVATNDLGAKGITELILLIVILHSGVFTNLKELELYSSKLSEEVMVYILG